MTALDALMDTLVDFAGLFPPAGCDMATAVRAYAGYRKGPYARFLGSFVVPAARLEDFRREVSALDADAASAGPWPVSVLAETPADADIERAIRFTAAGGAHRLVRVVSIETRAESADTVARVSSSVPGSMAVAFEIPSALARDDRRSVLAAVRGAGRIAKLRTGGTVEASIPTTREVAEFVWDCARGGAPFKATAGLHHPVRSVQRLTYAPDAPRALMHGFVNVFLAAVAAWTAAQGGGAASGVEPPAALQGILDERDAAAFSAGATAIGWRGMAFATAEIAGARAGLARSFGSCSFEEPVADLQALGWLARG